MKKILVIALFFLSRAAFADEVSFKGRGPELVVAGSKFQVVYELNARGGRDLHVDFPDEFEVLFGPQVSSSFESRSINGRTSSSHLERYTYTLKALRQGDVVVPAARIKLNGQEYTSGELKIRVRSEQEAEKAKRIAEENARKKSLLLRGTVSKRTVYEQEALVYTIKLYTRLSVRGAEYVEKPSFNGFLAHQIETADNVRPTIEQYGGIDYNTFVLAEYLLFPQHPGELEIPSVEMKFGVEEQVGGSSRGVFGNFYNATRVVNTVRSTSAEKIQVKALPRPQPADFTGAVGQFSLKTTISKQRLEVNDALTLKLTLSGTGNLKLIKPLSPTFSPDFEVYDPKVNMTSNVSGGRMSGSIVSEILAIPRFRGSYDLESLSMSYFDPQAGKYKRLKSEAYRIEVSGEVGHEERGRDSLQSGGDSPLRAVQQEEVKHLGEDIRFIVTDDLSLEAPGNAFFHSRGFFLYYLIPCLLTFLLFFVMRKRIKLMSDVRALQNKKANSMAKRRLRKALKEMKANNSEGFYEETMKALWAYLSHKLYIPVSELSKDNAAETLREHGVESEEVKAFMDIVDACEFARYAPNKEAGAMGRLYADACVVIEKIDKEIRRK